uniref:Uncharacterized protein n=1 Tax=Strigamia maritima TaxID=126957 RepID=T1IPL1_STRMM
MHTGLDTDRDSEQNKHTTDDKAVEGIKAADLPDEYYSPILLSLLQFSTIIYPQGTDATIRTKNQENAYIIDCVLLTHIYIQYMLCGPDIAPSGQLCSPDTSAEPILFEHWSGLQSGHCPD